MNITFITERFPPDSGGMAVSADRIVSGLRRRGHTVRVLHFTAENAHHLTATDAFAPRCNGPDGRESLFFELRPSLGNTALIGFGAGQSGYTATLWGKWLSRPSIVLFRGNDLDKMAQDIRTGWIFSFICENAGAVGAVTTEMAHRISAFRDNSAGFTPCGIDLPSWNIFPADRRKAERIRQRRLIEGPVVGMFGHLKNKKGVDLAVRVFRDHGLSAEATLMTVGEIDAGTRTMLRESCGDKWVLVPWQPPSKMPVWYTVCDIVFIPSLFDGMPNVLLEAMAAGIPVVASRAGGMPDVITDGVNGLLFTPGNDRDAASALRRMLAMDTDARQRMIHSAHETLATRFTPDMEIDAIEQLIKTAGTTMGVA